jgi:predicted nucleotidyltransferase
MLTNCEQKIMEMLLPQPFRAYSIRQINIVIKGSYALTYQSVHSLTHKKLIKAKKMGNSLSCQLNLSADPQLLAISSLIYSQGFLRRVRFSFLIDEIKERLNDLIYIMVLFGSHAKGTAKRSSDVDLLFVVQNEKDIEKTRGKIKSVLSSTKIKVEFEVITTEWLLKMFQEKNTVGREVLEGSIILYGAEQYYTLVRAYDQKRGH